MCDTGVLMRLAKAVGDAYKTGNREQLSIAEERLRDYESLIYESEGMIIASNSIEEYLPKGPAVV